jgi:hypothetical protein
MCRWCGDSVVSAARSAPGGGLVCGGMEALTSIYRAKSVDGHLESGIFSPFLNKRCKQGKTNDTQRCKICLTSCVLCLTLLLSIMQSCLYFRSKSPNSHQATIMLQEGWR